VRGAGLDRPSLGTGGDDDVIGSIGRREGHEGPEGLGAEESETDGGGDRQNLQVGATWLPEDRLQFDIRAGGGLVDSEQDWFFDIGVSFKSSN
jgi:hypothetical protein